MGEHHDNVIIYTERSSYIYIYIYTCVCVYTYHIYRPRALFGTAIDELDSPTYEMWVIRSIRERTCWDFLYHSPPLSSLLQNALTRTHRNWFANFVHEHTINTSCVLIRFEWSSIRYNAQICRFKIQFYMEFISCVALLLLLHILIFYKNINFFRCVSISSTKICHMKYIRVLCIHTSLSELESWIEPS